MKTRELVTGRYVDSRTYVLYKPDGSVFQTIREGEEFRIGNQMRPWVPVVVPRRSGEGTLLMCRKYGNSGDVIEEFPLLHNWRGLWALTSGSARRGVFHGYREPRGTLEKALAEAGYSARIIERVPEINRQFVIGGELCRHVTRKWGYTLYADGQIEELEEPPRVEGNLNQYHNGCICGTYEVLLHGGTYALYYSVSTSGNGSVREHLESILVTPDADEAKVAKIFSEGR